MTEIPQTMDSRELEKYKSMMRTTVQQTETMEHSVGMTTEAKRRETSGNQTTDRRNLGQEVMFCLTSARTLHQRLS